MKWFGRFAFLILALYIGAHSFGLRDIGDASLVADVQTPTKCAGTDFADGEDLITCYLWSGDVSGYSEMEVSFRILVETGSRVISQWQCQPSPQATAWGANGTIRVFDNLAASAPKWFSITDHYTVNLATGQRCSYFITSTSNPGVWEQKTFDIRDGIFRAWIRPGDWDWDIEDGNPNDPGEDPVEPEPTPTPAATPTPTPGEPNTFRATCTTALGPLGGGFYGFAAGPPAVVGDVVSMSFMFSRGSGTFNRTFGWVTDNASLSAPAVQTGTRGFSAPTYFTPVLTNGSVSGGDGPHGPYTEGPLTVTAADSTTFARCFTQDNDGAAHVDTYEVTWTFESGPTADTDTDGDGFSDFDEGQAGTDPDDAADYPGAPAPTPTPSPTPPQGNGAPPDINLDVDVTVDLCAENPDIVACQLAPPPPELTDWDSYDGNGGSGTGGLTMPDLDGQVRPVDGFGCEVSAVEDKVGYIAAAEFEVTGPLADFLDTENIDEDLTFKDIPVLHQIEYIATWTSISALGFVADVIVGASQFGANSLIFVWNMGVDMIVPGPGLSCMIEGHWADIQEHPPFSLYSELTATLTSALGATAPNAFLMDIPLPGGGSVPFPTDMLEEGVGPYRGVLAAGVWLVATLNAISIVTGSFGVVKKGQGGS